MKRFVLISLGLFALGAFSVHFFKIEARSPLTSGNQNPAANSQNIVASQPAASQEIVSQAEINRGSSPASKDSTASLGHSAAGDTATTNSDPASSDTFTTRIPENAVVASQSEDAAPGTLIVPDSSLEKPEDVGVKSHTNHLFIKPAPDRGMMASGSTTPSGESPQSLRAVYGLPATGGAGIIAIVDAYHYPTALNDFNVFARQFGLPVETSGSATATTNRVFQVVYASGNTPTTDAGWAQESALDIEWAHAMAPNAKIVLVEARSSSNSDLDAAVKVAAKLVGTKQVSMSWGSSEYRTETSEDSVFVQNGVVYFAASGDVGGVVNYPGTSPNVVSAGGTKINRNSSKVFVSETGWSGSGGGRSRYEARPAYQTAISSIVGSTRGTPDLSFDADPNSGVAVYDSTPYFGSSGWMVFGGTSVASPALAGIVNLANSGQASSAAELTRIYTNLGTTNFRDITSGSAGSNSARAGWDFVTGVGSSLGLQGK